MEQFLSAIIAMTGHQNAGLRVALADATDGAGPGGGVGIGQIAFGGIHFFEDAAAKKYFRGGDVAHNIVARMSGAGVKILDHGFAYPYALQVAEALLRYRYAGFAGQLPTKFGGVGANPRLMESTESAQAVVVKMIHHYGHDAGAGVRANPVHQLQADGIGTGRVEHRRFALIDVHQSVAGHIAPGLCQQKRAVYIGVGRYGVDLQRRRFINGLCSGR